MNQLPIITDHERKYLMSKLWHAARSRRDMISERQKREAELTKGLNANQRQATLEHHRVYTGELERQAIVAETMINDAADWTPAQILGWLLTFHPDYCGTL